MSQIQVELQEWMGSDRSIAEAAWTSSTTLQGKNKRTEEDVERVVKMLITDKHASPIESVVMRFWIKLPLQADRQHMTHRIASHNGMSGRYRTMPSEWFNTTDDVRMILNKLPYAQNGTYNQRDIAGRYDQLCQETNQFYTDVVAYAKECEKNGVISNKEFKRLREFYRGVLPQNNMLERVTIMNLRSFANYQALRNSEHAQDEIRLIAQLMLKEVKEKNVCPKAISMLESIGWDI